MPRTSTPVALNGEEASAWPSTIGAASRTPGTLATRVGDRVAVGQRRFERLHQQVAVEAEDLVEQFLAEAVHHRHHDDQRRDAEHDAEEGEPGDDRDEALLAPRAQIAQRQHPFEGREGAVAVGSLMDRVPCFRMDPGPRFHQILAIMRHCLPWPRQSPCTGSSRRQS